jgi:hypothetical protein
MREATREDARNACDEIRASTIRAHTRPDITLSSGELVSRFDYHRMNSDTGYCPCSRCCAVRMADEPPDPFDVQADWDERA